MTVVDRPATTPASSGGSAGPRLRGNLRQYGMIAALVVIVVLFEILTDGILLKPLNVTNLIMQNGYVLVLAIGMMLVIINREIDLSVGSVAAFVGAVTGVAIVNWGLPWPLVVVGALVTGGLIGAFQGFWIAYARIPAFIVTLGGMLLFRGLSMVVLQGQSIAPFPSGFRQLGSGFVPEFGAGDLHLVTILLGLAGAAVIVWNDWRSRARRREYGLAVPALQWFVLKAVAIVAVIVAFAWVLAVYQGLPIVGLVVIVLTAAYSFVTTSTVVGRHIYAVGGNERAAALSGIATKKTKFWVFVNMGVLAALAGLMFAARLNAATPKAGTNFELDAIAAAFIGGASASGGVGSVVGAIVGGLVMGVMNNGMSLLGLGVDWQQAIKGGVLMLAVAFDVYNKNKSK
ncbi:multiple monosaccharide ABC transporter permease [Microbispora amethystogenes]|uniref:Xylose transport system permease protein XylH n=1 Tax=Microbispora cellulosiformans TaxID=2614688 RepID=A0A5J5JTF7_9ACTN|nr:multiple monosaccharide ABC transporter permease [Microbispora cellulosiformans]KAA9373156.1 sugar ABC transporter permease [Microbispora cellulosiformans]